MRAAAARRASVDRAAPAEAPGPQPGAEHPDVELVERDHPELGGVVEQGSDVSGVGPDRVRRAVALDLEMPHEVGQGRSERSRERIHPSRLDSGSDAVKDRRGGSRGCAPRCVAHLDQPGADELAQRVSDHGSAAAGPGARAGRTGPARPRAAPRRRPAHPRPGRRSRSTGSGAGARRAPRADRRGARTSSASQTSAGPAVLDPVVAARAHGAGHRTRDGHDRPPQPLGVRQGVGGSAAPGHLDDHRAQAQGGDHAGCARGSGTASGARAGGAR